MAEAPHPKGNDGKSPRLIRPRGVAPKTVRRKAGNYRPLASFSLELRNDKANMRRLSSNSARPAGLGLARPRTGRADAGQGTLKRPGQNEARNSLAAPGLRRRARSISAGRRVDACGARAQLVAYSPKSSIVTEPTPLIPMPTEMLVAPDGTAGVVKLAWVQPAATASLADWVQ